jgi:hypothetical protein
VDKYKLKQKVKSLVAEKYFLYLEIKPVNVMKPIFLFFTLIHLLMACNNGNTSTDAEKSNPKENEIELEDRVGREKSKYTWPYKELNAFVTDCKVASADKIDKVKLNQFCACLVREAQEHYPSYQATKESSDKLVDNKIFESCFEQYKD